MKTNIILCVFLITLLSFVKAELASHVDTQKDDNNEHQLESLSNEEIRNTLLNLLHADFESNNSADDEDYEEDPTFDKRMTYRYGKRMTYRYGKRSAMPYRFGKRSGQVEPSSLQQILDYLRLHDKSNEIQNNKRMTYRYGRSLDKRSTD